MSAAAVVLAAGASARLGRPKQLLEIGGEPLVRRAARLCAEAGFAPVVVVLGSRAEQVEPALEGLAIQVVRNPDWPEGIAASIRAGIAALPEDVAAALLLPCDQPALGPGLLKEFLRLHVAQPASTLASAYAGGLGVPALFPRARFDGLLALRGNRGAKPLLGGATGIPFLGGEIDLDAPGDVEAWARRGGTTR